MLEVLEQSKGEQVERVLADSEIVFLVSGEIRLSYGKHIGLAISSGSIMFLPPGSRITADTLEDARLVVCRIRGVLQLCECLPLESLHKEFGYIKDCDFHILDIKERIYEYVDHFVKCLDDGLRCTYYYATKMKELFFLLRAYYTKRELAAFFAPILSPDSQFMDLMYRNLDKARSVQELIEISRYSPSGFKKQFQRVFGMPASEWLSQHKAALIFHELNTTKVSFKEMAYRYGFASVSSFSSFCRNKFGTPPGMIRSGHEHKAASAERSGEVA